MRVNRVERNYMKKTSLKMNFVMNAVLTISAFIFPLITFPYVSRILLPEGTGKVSFATSIVSYFTILAQLGMFYLLVCVRMMKVKEIFSHWE